MTADRITGSQVKAATLDVWLDGLFAGMIGALVVALWFLILDFAAGHPLWTPALLGSVLLHGAAATHQIAVQPLEIAAYTAFHFVAFIAVGCGLSYLMTLFERFPIVFFVLLVLFVSLQAGFFVLDAILRAELMQQLQPWTVVIANVLAAAAMGVYFWKRHPSVMRSIENLWREQ